VEVRKVLKASGARVLESELPVGMADSAFADDGTLADPDLATALGELLGDLRREVSAPLEVEQAA
jgi:chromate reductase